MPLINTKGELILKWKKYYVLSSTDADDENIVFFLSAKDNQELSKLLSKRFEKN